MSNNEKTITRKIYSLLVEEGQTFFLSIQYAFSLEEAYYFAKVEYEKQNRRSPQGGKIILFSIKTIDELNDSVQMESQSTNSSSIKKSTLRGNKSMDPASIPNPEELAKLDEFFKGIDEAAKEDTQKVETTPEEAKNNLMKEIIKNKDITMFNKNKMLFSKAERDYIRAFLK